MRNLLAFTAIFILAATTAQAESITGRASAADGDSLKLNDERIRLWGVDAPELAQSCFDAGGWEYACGSEAMDALDGFLAQSRPTTCTAVERDQYGRMVARCVRADGAEANAWLVASGWALAYTEFSGNLYVRAEDIAAKEGRGIWAGEFTVPSEWRLGDRSLTGAPADIPPPSTARAPSIAPPGDCRIKGNISGSGKRSYHLPGWASYEDTVIRVEDGERWFCSEAEAVAAGWRPAQ